MGDFHQMIADGLSRNFWCYTEDDGWKFSDFFLVPNAKPQHRVLDLKPLPKDYGKHTTPQQVAQRGGKLSKQQREAL
jgi:hypothetical protein